jgi:hypothetical protein
MSISPGYIAFKMATQLSPIILTGGIATALGGALPIIALTESGLSLLAGALSGSSSIELDNFFAHYTPLPGASLINNQVATYPFANQAIAANAIIAQPLNISLKMICPVRNLLGYPLKFATMSALQKSLSQHNSMGGTYSIVTPSYIYTYCIMTGMRDISGGDSKQLQYEWQLDFMQPLVSLQAAQQALSGLMQTITNGTPISGTPTWSSGLSIGNPTSALTQSLAPGGP